MSGKYPAFIRKSVALGLLVFLVYLVYSNTYDVSWHLDDYPNIIQNEKLHLSEFSRDAILTTFFASPQFHKYGDLYRPATCLTFALNWYVGQDKVFGYHLVNTTIHLLTAFVLFLTCLTLFATPRLINSDLKEKYGVALLAAVLWAVNPVQTQAVTYIVQRMASMCAMFYLLGIYCYIKARLNKFSHQRGMLFAACIICYLLAIGSKENAAILPLALILIEIAFFQKSGDRLKNSPNLWLAVGAAFFVFLTGALFFLKGDIFSFLNGYNTRPFTLGQRLLTEPSVLVVYLSQIFFPSPHRLSIAHDLVVSKSLFDPLTTLPSILLVTLLVAIAIYRIRTWPLASFGLLFFFLNHLIESTVLPLELFFEHRAYLSSLFLFLPVAAGISQLISGAAKKSRVLKFGVALIVVLAITAMGFGTYRRNVVWATERSLWEDALQKAPGNARPYLVLAGEYEKRGEFEKALAYYRKSLSLPDQRPRQARGLAHNNMGTIYLKTNNFAKAREHYQNALEIRPGHARYLHNLVLALVKARQWEEASRQADVLLSKQAFNSDYFNLKSYILLKQHQPQEAIVYLKRALSLAPLDRNTAINFAIALSLTGDQKRAEGILKQISNHQPADMIILMCLIENSLRAKNSTGFDRYADKLLALYSAAEINQFLLKIDDGRIEVPLAPELLAPAIADRLKQKFIKTG